MSVHLYAAFGYLSLATGGFGLGPDVSAASVAIGTACALAAALAVSGTWRLDGRIVALAFAATAVLASYALASDDIPYALRKFDGFVVGGAITAILIHRGCAIDRSGMLRALVRVGVAVLVLTALYKLAFGFFDRQTRFLVNGPIVFGWLMAMMAVTSVHIAQTQGRRSHLALAILFMAAVVWTGSKGPIAAALPAFAYLYLSNGRAGHLLAALAAAAFTLLVLLEYGLLPDRLGSLYRIATGALEGGDAGSIGVRARMIADSWEVFRQNPLFGVGLGNWSGGIGASDGWETEFRYPHNIAMEALAETGLTGLAIFATLLACVFRSTDVLGRTYLVLFLGCLQFSGDMSYWRFLFFLPLGLAYRSPSPLRARLA